TFPEQAAIALARASAYGTWRAKPRGLIPSFPDVRVDEAASVVATALERGDGWLDPSEVDVLLGCYGIRTVASGRTATAEEGANIAHRIGGPVALKAVGQGLVHKTELGAVALNVPANEVAERAGAMVNSVRS